MNSINQNLSFKCNLLSCLHSDDKRLALDYKKKLDSIGCFAVKVDQKLHRLVVRAVCSTADQDRIGYFPSEDFELVLESELLPLHRYNDQKEFIVFGKLQAIEYHQKDKFCEKCRQASFTRDKETHDIVCRIESSSLTLSSQQDSDFSIII
jgi:hypothetical protein